MYVLVLSKITVNQDLSDFRCRFQVIEIQQLQILPFKVTYSRYMSPNLHSLTKLTQASNTQVLSNKIDTSHPCRSCQNIQTKHKLFRLRCPRWFSLKHMLQLNTQYLDTRHCSKHGFQEPLSETLHSTHFPARLVVCRCNTTDLSKPCDDLHELSTDAVVSE